MRQARWLLLGVIPLGAVPLRNLPQFTDYRRYAVTIQRNSGEPGSMPAIGLRWRHNTVRTLAAGIVASEGKLRGYGHAIIVDHGHGWHTFYSHLSKVRVKKGQAVAAGDILGRSAKKSFLLFSYLGKPVDPHKILKQPHGQPYHQALREKTWHAAHRFSSERARQGNGLGIG